MQQITRILVANDRLDGMAIALGKAAVIEHYTGAEIRALTVAWDAVADEPDAVIPEPQRAMLIEALKAAERQGLRQASADVQEHVANLDCQVVWNRSAREAILDVAGRFGADLIIKPVSPHHPLGDYLHAPLDWSLMREAACAVLVSRSPDWSDRRCVLAAIDATDTRHQALTRAVLTTAATLADTLGVPLHVATAYPSLGQHVNELEVAMDYEGIKADMRATRTRALAHWISTLALVVADADRHVIEGKPASVIPELANQLGANVTVLGTAARSGIGKVLLGNTAEDTINRIQGDVLTVREPWH